MVKRISALMLSVIMAASVLTACGSSDSSSVSSAASNGVTSETSTDSETASASDDSTSTDSTVPDPSLTISGEEVDTEDLVMFTIDDMEVDFDTFRYYYYYTANLYTKNYGYTLDEILAEDGGFEALLESTVSQITYEYVTYKLAEDNNITLDEDEQAEVDEMIQNAKDSCSTDDEYTDTLKESYMTEELFENMLELSELYDKVISTLFQNEGKYATKQEDFLEIVQDPEQYARVVSILIPYQCQAEITDEDTLDSYDDMTLSEKLTAKKTAYASLEDDEQEELKESAKQLAEDVLEKAKNGDDFDSLIEEYGWDPGMETYMNGYYINTESSFVEEYLDAAFELEENEVSDLVESTSYGWFILKRLPIDMDYVEENIETLINDYDEPTINTTYNEIMNEMEITYSDYYNNLTSDSIQ